MSENDFECFGAHRSDHTRDDVTKPPDALTSRLSFGRQFRGYRDPGASARIAAHRLRRRSLQRKDPFNFNNDSAFAVQRCGEGEP